MKGNELKRLNRRDLLEMLLDLRRENDRLRQELEQTRKELNDRTLVVEQSGSLAEAVVKLNGLMEAAQAACDQYTYNMQQRCREEEARCRELELATQQKCEQMLIEAAQQAEKMRTP